MAIDAPGSTRRFQSGSRPYQLQHIRRFQALPPAADLPAQWRICRRTRVMSPLFELPSSVLSAPSLNQQWNSRCGFYWNISSPLVTKTGHFVNQVRHHAQDTNILQRLTFQRFAVVSYECHTHTTGELVATTCCPAFSCVSRRLLFLVIHCHLWSASYH